MLKEIHLKNYRGFEEHTIPLQPLTVIVGRNNAGKSTIVEALRLVALVVRRLKNLNFSSPPQWLTLPRRTRGVSPSLRNMEVDLKTVNYRYGDPPAVITATLTNQASISIYVGDSSIYAVTHDASGRMLRNKSGVSSADLPSVNILPQIGPLLKEERILNPEYVEATISSSLASLHFRNQLHLYYDELFPGFQRAVQATWPGLRVLSLEGRGRWPSEDNLALFVQDGDFSAEASWMGHGLQMWLQTMWFLVRAKGADTVILDEPDVYMHADLQRKLIRYVRGRFPQVIIATHSTEIIAEVEPEQILIVDRSKPRSNFAASLPAVQQLIEGVGSVHNLQLTRLWSARRFLMVEGDDLDLLKRFQDTLFPSSAVPFDTLPSMEINGWGGWNYAVGSSMLLENAGGEGITTYCILDADYHREEIEARYDDARTRGVQLHIWNRKEIENYLLVPPAIQRIISASLPENARRPSIQEITDKLDELAFALQDEVFDNFASELHKRNRHWDTGTANKRAREIVNGALATVEGRLSIISGKRALSLLTAWSKDSHNVSFSVVRLARELTKEEIAPEVQKVVSAIEYNQKLLIGRNEAK